MFTGIYKPSLRRALEQKMWPALNYALRNSRFCPPLQMHSRITANFRIMRIKEQLGKNRLDADLPMAAMT